MKIELVLDSGGRITCTLPHDKCAWVETKVECPSGGHYLDVRSDERHVINDRRYEGRAYCMACKREVGKLVVTPNTLFGIREDEAVGQRCRVY
jgi:hypothetical protein